MSRLKDRFECKFIKGDGCWEWLASKHKRGYGQFRCRVNGKQEQYAHRVSMFLYRGFNLSEDICVCHTCDNPSCVNPSHLFLGSQKDNLLDMKYKGRHVCPNRKLNDDDRELCQLMREVGVRNIDIASHFGISQSVASVVSRGMRHNHEVSRY